VSERDVETVRGLYVEFGRGNFWAAEPILDPDVEWHWSSEWTELSGAPAVTHGVEQLVDTARRFLFRIWEHYSVEAEEFIDLDDRVLVLTRNRGRMKESTADVELMSADLWTFRDGRVVRFDAFYDRRAALAAVGLAPST
jgi:uncharacterized protein